MPQSLTGERRCDLGDHAVCQDWRMITLDDFDTFPDFPVEGVLFYDIAPILVFFN
jgi:hypothetical protein